MSRLCLFLCLAVALFATDIPESIRHWWVYTQALSNDSMQGRDTGSDGYRRAASYVASKFQEAGLKPAGSHAFYQPVSLHEVRLISTASTVRLTRRDGIQNLEWLRDITAPAALNMPKEVNGKLVFIGSNPQAIDIKDKIVVRLRSALTSPEHSRPDPFHGATAIVTVDSTAGPEPPRWPAAYSVTMRLRDDPLPSAPSHIAFRFNPANAEELFTDSGHSYRELKGLSDAGKPLPSFDIPATLDAAMRFETKDLNSDNIIAVLPGSDPELSKQYVAISAHLDGYGFGEPWNGDRIYNGTFDDAAYVATLMDFADKLHAAGIRPKRSVLFCVFTGEEKGLLGSKYFTTHLTIPAEQVVADINLDQLRPIFPLRLLTALAINDSTLGDDAKQVAQRLGIRLQPDPEPERNLLRRSDHYSFMQIGVPSMGFIFGYDKGSSDETIYRSWYAQRYHSPADDLSQPWDPAAAEKFNEFFRLLIIKVANDPNRPVWNPASPLAHRASN